MVEYRKVTTTREHEHTLNVWLAEKLHLLGLIAQAEVSQPGNRRIDVEVRIGPAVIAVEAEHGQSSAKQAEAVRDADARIAQKLAHCAVAVCYPDGTTPESLAGAKLMWTVRDGGEQQAEWKSGGLDSLASVIRLAPAQLGNPDYAAAALSVSLDRAIRRLTQWQKQQLARALDLPPSSDNGKSVLRWDKAAKRSLLVVATAVMFHSRLDAHLAEMRPEYDSRVSASEPFTGEWPPMMAHRCAAANNPLLAFQEAWDLILALDYKPIFETACVALDACPPDPAFADAVRDAAQAALTVASNIAGLRHDLLGRIFHTVLDTARYDGSFYTTTAAATLLAALAIRKDMCDWSDPDAIARLRIIDPACGTGTLLMAAAERIRELSPDLRDDETVASALIERVLWGYDINVTATHMAATTLGLLSPTTRFRSMKIGRAFLGVNKNDRAFLGSLEYLNGGIELVPWPDSQQILMPWPNTQQSVTQVDTGEEMAHPDPADLVIMNPPFTRDSLRHDQFNREDEKKLKDREKLLFSKKPVHLTSNGNAFLILADYITKAESCTIAAVLPLVTSTNASSLEIRKYLASRYHVDTIVTSHDPDRIYFSENTNIGEILVVCRRWPDRSKRKPPTRVVNLARNPETPADALAVAWAVEDSTVEKRSYGTVQEWPELRIREGNWGAVQFLSGYLCNQFVRMKEGELFSPCLLGDISEIGPDGRGVRGMFNRSGMPSPEGMIALYDHKTDHVQSMATKTDSQITAKLGKERQAGNLWKQRGTLLLPMRLFLQTTRVLSVRLDTPALGSAWVPCKLKATGIESEALEKALCVYLNSSVGVLALLGDRSNKKPTYPRFSMDDLRKIPVPDFAAIDGAADRLAKAYDAHAKDALLPLPSMDDCQTRRALDDAVVDALDLDAETVAAIRRSLSEEPSVTGRRYEGLVQGGSPV